MPHQKKKIAFCRHLQWEELEFIFFWVSKSSVF